MQTLATNELSMISGANNDGPALQTGSGDVSCCPLSIDALKIDVSKLAQAVVDTFNSQSLEGFGEFESGRRPGAGG